MRGKENARLVAYDYINNQEVWEEIINDNFEHSGSPAIINNTVHLISNQFSGELETTLYGYDSKTGVQKFIKEFSRNNKSSSTVEVILEYNHNTSDSLNTLILNAGKKSKTYIFYSISKRS